MTETEVLVSWLNGAAIEARPKDSRAYWLKVPNYSEEGTFWNLDCTKEYRLAKEATKFRVALIRSSAVRPSFCYSRSVDDNMEALEVEKNDNFVRWLTDWTEYT